MIRRLSATLLTIVVLLSVALAPTLASAKEPDPVADGSKWIGSCLQSARSVSTLFVFDRSGSLSGTDPSGVRYEGLETALQQLARLTRSDGKPLSVEVAVASFDDRYDEARAIVGWRSINDDPATQDREIAQIIKTARERTTPRGGTDFEKPLVGGLAEFAGRQTNNNCRLMFWFTDGQFEHNPIGVDAARANMCAPGGIVDQLRQAGIVIIGLQLGTVSRDLKPMALGEASGTTCGTRPLPEGWAPGIYLEAADTAGLKRIFGRLTDIVQGCTPAGSSGVIDPGVHRLRVTIDTPKLSKTVRFDAPSGASFTAGTDGDTATGGYRVRAIRDDHYVSMDVTLPMNAPAGQWRVTPDVPVQPTDITFCVFSDLRLMKPTLLPDQTGVTTLVKVPVVDRDGKPADLSVYKSVTPAVSVVAHGGVPRTATATVDPSGTINIEIAADPTDARVDIGLRVHLITASDLTLSPLAIDFPQALVLPSEFPVIEPRDVLDLGKTVKAKPAEGELKLMGSPDGPTQVCLGAPVNVVVPADAAGTTIDYPTGCIDLAVGETKVVKVSVTPTTPAVGDGEGAMPVRLVSASTKDGSILETSFELPVIWRFTDPTNYLITTVITVIVGALSALIPLLAIGIAGWVAARYDMRGLKATAFDVVVTRDGVRRAEPIPELPGRLVDPLSFSSVPGAGQDPCRSFEFDGIRFRSKASIWPTRAPRFWAEASPGRSLLSSMPHPGDPDDGSSVTTTPGLGFVSLLHCANADLADPKKKEIRGRLVILTKSLAMEQAQLDSRAASGLDVRSFRQRERSQSAKTTPDHQDTQKTSTNSMPPDLWD